MKILAVINEKAEWAKPLSQRSLLIFAAISWAIGS